jgi:hypothetical protein
MTHILTIRRAAKIGAALALIVPVALVQARDIAVKLTGAQEVPKVQTPADAKGTISVNKDHSITGSIKTVAIDGTMAHIHVAPRGKNGPPIITLVKSGGNLWSVPEGSKLTDEQYKSYKKGELYVNVHSAANPGGEIRAQIKP